jgi:hypothetical protein
MVARMLGMENGGENSLTSCERRQDALQKSPPDFHCFWIVEEAIE